MKQNLTLSIVRQSAPFQNGKFMAFNNNLINANNNNGNGNNIIN